MKTKNADLPAHPTDALDNGLTAKIHQGLTKRECFAGLAMQGLLAKQPHVGLIDYISLANQSIKMADELLKQLTP